MEAVQALSALGKGFIPPESWNTACEVVEAAQLPEPFSTLLVHNDHMTTRLRDYYGATVELKVLDHRLDGHHYARKIVLTLAGTGQVVEFGIMRIDTRSVGQEARDQIMAARLPLGDVLIRHNVLRRVEPQAFFRFGGGSPILNYFGADSEKVVYGRLATLFCDNIPVIALLEVVCGRKPNAEDRNLKSQI